MMACSERRCAEDEIAVSWTAGRGGASGFRRRGCQCQAAPGGEVGKEGVGSRSLCGGS